jgi:CRISPR-associated protein Csm2
MNSSNQGRPYSQSGNRPQGASPPPTLDQLWSGYLRSGYFDENGNLRTEYVCREKIVPLAEAMTKGRDVLTSHQIRRYFGHCRSIEARLLAKKAETRQAVWEGLRAEFCKLDIAAADGSSKSPPKIPELFHEFIRRNVAAVKTEKDFREGFMPHFEALLGFGAKFFKDERR